MATGSIPVARIFYSLRLRLLLCKATIAIVCMYSDSFFVPRKLRDILRHCKNHQSIWIVLQIRHEHKTTIAARIQPACSSRDEPDPFVSGCYLNHDNTASLEMLDDDGRIERYTCKQGDTYIYTCVFRVILTLSKSNGTGFAYVNSAVPDVGVELNT